jgi:hypothetical protein
MTPQEKAEELVEKFRLNVLDYENNGLNSFKAKQCALIAVDEIMYNNLMEYPQHSMIYSPHKNDYWQEVKQEIEKL